MADVAFETNIYLFLSKDEMIEVSKILNFDYKENEEYSINDFEVEELYKKGIIDSESYSDINDFEGIVTNYILTNK